MAKELLRVEHIGMKFNLEESVQKGLRSREGQRSQE